MTRRTLSFSSPHFPLSHLSKQWQQLQFHLTSWLVSQRLALPNSFIEKVRSLSTLFLPSLAHPSPPNFSECTQCFDTIYLLGPLGLDVCLECFNGSCSTGSTNQHSLLHAKNTGHMLVVNIIKRKKPQEVKKQRVSLPWELNYSESGKWESWCERGLN